MGSSWSGFQPQNEVVRLHWALLEAIQTEGAAQALGILLAKAVPKDQPQEQDGSEENPWSTTER
jgi:hypothetical protein